MYSYSEIEKIFHFPDNLILIYVSTCPFNLYIITFIKNKTMLIFCCHPDIRILVKHSLGIIQFGCRQCFRTIEKLHFVSDLYKHILRSNKILKRYNILCSLWCILYKFVLSSRILFQYCHKKHHTHVWLHVSPRLPVWLSVSCDNASPLVVSLVNCYFWSRMSYVTRPLWSVRINRKS